jgi:hypothetical protein
MERINHLVKEPFKIRSGDDTSLVLFTVYTRHTENPEINYTTLSAIARAPHRQGELEAIFGFPCSILNMKTEKSPDPEGTTHLTVTVLLPKE